MTKVPGTVLPLRLKTTASMESTCDNIRGRVLGSGSYVHSFSSKD